MLPIIKKGSEGVVRGANERSGSTGGGGGDARLNDVEKIGFPYMSCGRGSQKKHPGSKPLRKPWAFKVPLRKSKP